MSQFGYREPQLVGTGQIKEPKMLMGNTAQNAFFRRGSVLISKTTGTITAPPAAGSGGLATAAAPTSANVTITNAVTAGAAAATYYIQTSYTATSQESPLSVVFVQNCPAGYTPSVTVASAGAPAGATDFAAYIGISPGFMSLQQASKTTTALGTAYVVPATLTNSQGWAQGATGTSSGIVGIALADSNANYFDGGGGSFLAGNAGSRLGATSTLPPLTPFEAQGVYALGLGYGQFVQMSLVNTTAWYPNLLYSQAGLTLDATTGFFVVDPGQTACLTIVDHRDGAYIGPTGNGTVGDTGVQVVVEFLASALAVS